MKILITGANGQLGQELQIVFKNKNVIPLTRQQLDISNLSQVREAVSFYQPDVLINAASYNFVDKAETDESALAFATNQEGSKNLALATAEKKIVLVHVSTDYVFDGRSHRPYHEEDTPSPRSIYGASKLAGENEVLKENPMAFIVRTSWLYRFGGRNFPMTLLEWSKNKEVKVINDQWSGPTYVPFLAQALEKLIKTEAYGIFHISGRGGGTWFEFAQVLYHELGLKTPLIPITSKELGRPAPRPAYSIMTTLREPQILLPPWQEGVAAFAKDVMAKDKKEMKYA